MNNPEISVIIPVYNGQSYISRCVESILRQTYEDYEILLIDDGSTDSSPIICDKYSTENSKIRVVHKENGGLSDARNMGIKESQGKYITFVDNDDWIEPQMLEKLYDAAKVHAADIVMCNHQMRYSGDDNKKEAQNENHFDKEYTQDEFLNILLRVNSNRCVHYACAKLYRRSVIEEPEYFPYKMYNEDVEAMFKSTLRSSKIVEIGYVGYNYFYNSEGISHSTFGENFLSLTNVWDRVVELLQKEKPEYAEYAILNRKRTCFTILWKSITYGSKETDKKYRKQLTDLRRELKSNIWDILKGSIVLNRKCAIVVLLLFYNEIRAGYRFIK